MQRLFAFVRIVLPNIKSALTTLFLLFFLSTWDSYLVPLIVLNKDTLYTIPLMIATLSNAHFTDNAARMLTLTLSTIPVITIFAIGSKSLIQGLVAGSLKE
jgi:multiple sugar transport system permease protein/cellobiose transport system permease protein